MSNPQRPHEEPDDFVRAVRSLILFALATAGVVFAIGLALGVALALAACGWARL